jgi:zinc transporter ZupT
MFVRYSTADLDNLDAAQGAHAPPKSQVHGLPTTPHGPPHAGPTDRRVGAGDVFWMTTVMAAACGIGALPFFFIDELSKGWAALANAVACGVMLAASFDLVHESDGHGSLPLIVGLISGCVFIKVLQDWLHQYEGVKFEGFTGANAQKILLFVGIMAAHAIGEGCGVGAPHLCHPLLMPQPSARCCAAASTLHRPRARAGVSFCGRRGWAHGLLVTLAIGIHNVPEGLAVATVLVARGTPPRKALEWTLLCALPQPLFAVPSFLFVESFRALLPASYGFAAGCMIWIVVAELLPDALDDMNPGARGLRPAGARVCAV